MKGAGATSGDPGQAAGRAQPSSAPHPAHIPYNPSKGPGKARTQSEEEWGRQREEGWLGPQWAASPGSLGSCSPGPKGWQVGGRSRGTPSKLAALQGQAVALSSWKSNWEPLATLRGWRLHWRRDCWSECPRGMGKGSQRAGGQPWGAGGHRHASKHCTLVAAMPTVQHIAFCAASSCTPIWRPQHKKMVQSRANRAADPRARLGAAAVPCKPSCFLRGGSHAASAAQRGVAGQAETSSSPKRLHPQRLKVPSHLPAPCPSPHYFRISPTGCHGAHEGAVCSAQGGPQTQRGHRGWAAPHLYTSAVSMRR